MYFSDEEMGLETPWNLLEVIAESSGSTSKMRFSVTLYQCTCDF